MTHFSVSHRTDAQHQDTLPSVLCVVYERNSKWPTGKGGLKSEGTAEMCDKKNNKGGSFPPLTTPLSCDARRHGFKMA